MVDIHNINECPDCGSLEIVYNERRQQVTCKDCGLIYEPLTPKEEATYLNQEQTYKKAPRAKVKKKAVKR